MSEWEVDEEVLHDAVGDRIESAGYHDDAIARRLWDAGYDAQVITVYYADAGQVEVHLLPRYTTRLCVYTRPNTPPEFTYNEVADWLLPVLLLDGWGESK